MGVASEALEAVLSLHPRPTAIPGARGGLNRVGDWPAGGFVVPHLILTTVCEVDLLLLQRMD